MAKKDAPTTESTPDASVENDAVPNAAPQPGVGDEAPRRTKAERKATEEAAERDIEAHAEPEVKRQRQLPDDAGVVDSDQASTSTDFHVPPEMEGTPWAAMQRAAAEAHKYNH